MKSSAYAANMARATDFIKEKVASEDYFLSAQSSDLGPCPVDRYGHVFVSWFILQALGRSVDESSASALHSRILQDRVGGIWGYGEGQPLDADDTAFALRSLYLLGETPSVLELLAFHSPKSQAFRTFQGPSPAEFSAVQSLAGHMGAHLEVNANVFSLMQQVGVFEFVHIDSILRRQAPDGSWSGYFYPGKYYATLFCLECLDLSQAKNPDEATERAMQRAIEFLLADQNPDGSWGANRGPYSTALALWSLARTVRSCGAGARGIEFLRSTQRPDGSWASDEVVFEYLHRDDPLVVWRAYDVNRVLTTSLALGALKAGFGGR